MKLAYSSNAFRRFSLPDAIDRIADLGYAGVEILADVPHAFPPRFDAAARAAARARLGARGLAVSNLNTFMLYGIESCHRPSWIEPDPARRAMRVRHTIDCLRVAADLGAPSISTEPGGPLDPGMTRARALDLFAEGLGEVLPLAERLGVELLVEPEPELLIETSGQFDAFAARFDSPALGLNFDVGHFFCSGEDPAALVRKYGPKVRHVHLEDIAPDRRHRHLVPGAGAIDFAALFAALRDTGYQGWITVELYPYEDDPVGAGRRAMDHLRRFL